MDEIFEDYFEAVIEIAETLYDLTKDEVVYNKEHFEECFYEGTDAERAVFLLSTLCI